jgi:hypothetical protein
MPLFRRHRGQLDSSLLTTVIVKNIDELRSEIINDWEMWLGHPEAAHSNFKEFTVKVFIPGDLSIKESFDPRCGWYTHYVTADLLCKDEFQIVGFLSEPMNE